MLPELFRIPFLNLPVHTYGAMYVLGLIAGIVVAYRQALLSKKYHNDILDYAFWALIGALLGGRALYIIVEHHYYFVENPFTQIGSTGISIPTFLALWKGGFVFWGGALGGAVALAVFCLKRRIPMGEFADYCAPALAIGHAFGRIGCVAGGCCYGKEYYHLDSVGNVVANGPFGLSFPEGSIAYDALSASATPDKLSLMQKIHGTLPLFPVQLLESFGNIVIFAILLLATTQKRAHGQITLLYFILYSMMRAFTETFRGDSARGFVIEGLLSTSQFISLVMSLAALVGMIYLAKRQNSGRVYP